jgi:hypothetical protein
MFQNPQGDIAVEEGHEFAEEATRIRYPMCVGSLPPKVSILNGGNGAGEVGVPNVQVPSERIV